MRPVFKIDPVEIALISDDEAAAIGRDVEIGQAANAGLSIGREEQAAIAAIAIHDVEKVAAGIAGIRCLGHAKHDLTDSAGSRPIHCGAAHMPAPTARRGCSVPLICSAATSKAGESSVGFAEGEGEWIGAIRNCPSGDQLSVGVHAQVDRVL